MIDKIDLLRDLSIGSRVAEDEIDHLSRYFVATDQWRRIIAGNVDVVFGAKGAGKSAIYTTLVGNADELFDRQVILVPGENPRGTPAFADLMSDPPTSEMEFIALWKFYVLMLVSEALHEWGVSGDEVRLVRDILAESGLVPAAGGLKGLVRRARDYVARMTSLESVEAGMRFDPSGAPIAFTTKITLREPTAVERANGFVSVDDLLATCAEILDVEDVSMWIVFDRLDVAFADSRELEANALRALFRVYLDLLTTEALRLKIFLRTDIWRAVTEGGFREASHVTREVTIKWSDASLLNLVVRRLLQNRAVLDRFQVDADEVLRDAIAQRSFFDQLVPDQIDSGRNPKTFEWMLGRVADGSGQAAPRELIHLLDQTRQEQLAMLERGESEPEGHALFSRQAFRDALPEVSRVRLEQTIYAEYPNLRRYVEALQGEKTNQSLPTLARIWEVTDDEARKVADQLVEIGFFQRRGGKDRPAYWVPFLYRSGLAMVQGSADPNLSEEE